MAAAGPYVPKQCTSVAANSTETECRMNLHYGDCESNVRQCWKHASQDLRSARWPLKAVKHTDLVTGNRSIYKNKCISRLARHKSHYSALVDAATPSSEPRCTPPPTSPLTRQQMRSSANAATATGHTIRTEAWWGLAVLSALIVPGDLDLWPPKWEKACPASRPTHTQNFTPLAVFTAEKSVTVQRNEKKTKNDKITHSKQNIPHTTVWWDKKHKLQLWLDL